MKGAGLQVTSMLENMDPQNWVYCGPAEQKLYLGDICSFEGHNDLRLACNLFY